MSLAVLLALLPVVGLAAPPPGCYADAMGKTGAELRSALHEIIDDHASIPYSSTYFDTADALAVLDAAPGLPSSVSLVYSGRVEPVAAFRSVWNREHLWPNSYGIDDRQPAYSTSTTSVRATPT
ncbi:hypothetical protein BH23VER1_BH23VER1_20950 [soil metagenome]